MRIALCAALAVLGVGCGKLLGIGDFQLASDASPQGDSTDGPGSGSDVAPNCYGAGLLGSVCVPLGDGPTLEGAPESDWLRLYGQRDHVRIYGMDIVDRMTRVGLAVETVDTHKYFTNADQIRHGLRGDDRILFVVRKAAGERAAARPSRE